VVQFETPESGLLEWIEKTPWQLVQSAVEVYAICTASGCWVDAWQLKQKAFVGSGCDIVLP